MSVKDEHHVLPTETPDATADARHSDVVNPVSLSVFNHNANRDVNGGQGCTGPRLYLSGKVVDHVGLVIFGGGDREASPDAEPASLAGGDVGDFHHRVLTSDLVGDATTHEAHDVHAVRKGRGVKGQGVGLEVFGQVRGQRPRGWVNKHGGRISRAWK